MLSSPWDACWVASHTQLSLGCMLGGLSRSALPGMRAGRPLTLSSPWDACWVASHAQLSLGCVLTVGGPGHVERTAPVHETLRSPPAPSYYLAPGTLMSPLAGIHPKSHPPTFHNVLLELFSQKTCLKITGKQGSRLLNGCKMFPSLNAPLFA